MHNSSNDLPESHSHIGIMYDHSISNIQPSLEFSDFGRQSHAQRLTRHGPGAVNLANGPGWVIIHALLALQIQVRRRRS